MWCYVYLNLTSRVFTKPSLGKERRFIFLLKKKFTKILYIKKIFTLGIHNNINNKD